MNFNLVSPYDSAHAFTARFKEDVQIPKNSSVYLNYAKIERDRRIVLDEENTIELIYDYPLPMFIPGTPATKTMINNAEQTVTIPKGTYSATSLAEEVNKRIQTLFNRNTAVQNTRGMYNCGPLNVINFRESNGPVGELVNNRGESGFLLSVIQNQVDSVYANAPKDTNGLQPLNSYINAEFVADAANQTNHTGNAGDAATGIAYRKTADVVGVNTYDNYAISQQPLQHYAVKTFGTNLVKSANNNQSLFVSAGGDIENHIEECPRLWATTRRNLDNINVANGNGREFCGLYSQPYASGLPQINPANLNTMGFSADPKRTRGTASTNGVGNENPRLEDGVPQCYFGVEIGGQNGAAGNYKTLKVYGCAQDVGGATEPPTQANAALFPHGGAKIDRMILLKTIALDDVVDGGPLVSDDDVVSFAIIPHYKTQYLSGRNDNPTESVYQGFVNRTKLHFSVCLKTTSGGWKEVYDSGNHALNDIDWHIWGQLLEGGNERFIDTQSKDMINMNIPFHPFLSSTSTNGGFQRVTFTQFERGPDTEPRVLIDRLRFKFSSELSSYIDSSKVEVAKDGQSVVQQFTSHTIYPTLPHYTNDFFPILPFFNNLGGVDQQFAGLVALDDLYADTSDDAYVIYINNLPLKNYKNTRNSRLVSETKGGYNKNILANVPLPYQTQYLVDNRLIGYYEPYLKAISDMKNQNFKTNYFDIEIRNALDDSPASYLRSAVINFTIVDKKSKLIN